MGANANAHWVRWSAIVSIGAIVLVGAGRAWLGMPAPTARAYTYLLTVAAVAFVWLASDASLWIPELGPALLPPRIIQYEHQPEGSMVVSTDATATIAVKERDAIGVVYWAAEPAPTATTFADAHSSTASFDDGGLSNGGVARVVNGAATLNFRCPRRIKIAGGFFTLPKHVYYRIVYGSGRISAVKKFDVSC